MLLESSEIEVPDEFKEFVGGKSFSCVMAKAALKKGFVKSKDLGSGMSAKESLRFIYEFVKEYRRCGNDLSSFIFFFEEERFKTFSAFEKFFWDFILDLKRLDQDLYPGDQRVGADPIDPDFGYSLMEEAFFLIVLHPGSPRKARRYFKPAIVFNPHQQFEKMRINGSFEKVRSLIREKDARIQKEKNQMLQDYGAGNEILQYTGRQYAEKEKNKLMETVRERLFKGL